MHSTFSVCLCIIMLSIFPFSLLLGTLVDIVATPQLAYSQPCANNGSTVLEPLEQNTGSHVIFHFNNNERSMGQEKVCSVQRAQLVIITHVNNTGCLTKECLSASNSNVMVVGNNPKPVSFKGSSIGTAVDLGLSNYAVVGSGTSAFYRHVLSPDCSGIISGGGNKKCIITNPYANNIQTWVDNTSNIKIQFSRSPIFPFVGNATQLNFQVTSSNASKPLELTHIHITLIKNVTANLNNNDTMKNKDDFITFDNLTARHGVFSVKYQFLEEGVHQVIVKINTKNGEVALASFDIPVLRSWWNLF
jgi:hypothetical protein